ncbi:MAG: DUF1858 domain-containing protein [Patescibacteria group bacterium]|jgi:hypothetical protein
MAAKKKNITKDTLIGEVLWEYPEAQEIMLKYFGDEVACVFCPGQSFDSFGMIAELHGVDEATINAMLKDMNELVKKNK